MQKTVAIGMSGGVDSSVSAYLLKKQGYRVIGLFMKNWEETDSSGTCIAQQDQEDAQKVSNLLDIPLYTVNFVSNYWDSVFASFLDDLAKGYTPNPDVLCNREIKFKSLFQKARSLGADFLATGHYCQTDGLCLRKGLDPHKDQSYFLYTLQQSILPHILFPVGNLLKEQVRKIAYEQKLPTAEKKDSTGICFIGKRNFKSFISQYIPYQKGLIKTTEGATLAEHDGVAYYTLGQRKGLQIGGAGDAWFVVDKDISSNTLIVAQGKDHPRLYHQKLKAHGLSWVRSETEETILRNLPFRCWCKIRYRQEDVACTLTEYDGKTLYVSFDEPQRAITPLQSIVFYTQEICLGGAFITSALPQ